jgi:hypothetical protein
MDLLTTLDTNAASASASALGISAAQISNGTPRKTRSACNRCHSQKLRCIKNISHVSCERCLKLKRSCKFSPRVPRAPLKQPEPTDPSSLDGIHELLPTTTSTLAPNEYASQIIPGSSGNQWHLPDSTETVIAEEGTFHSYLFPFLVQLIVCS